MDDNKKSFFDDLDASELSNPGYAPIYHGHEVAKEERRIEKSESKEGRVVLNGVNVPEKRIDRIAVYSLIIGILSIMCILLDNGYLVSLLAMLIAYRSIEKGTRKRSVAIAAIVCSVVAILMYILCVAAKPIIQDLPFYQSFMECVGKYWPL